MDKASWGMIAFMLATFMYFMVQGAGGGELPFAAYLQMFGFSLLMLVALVAIMCIPVLIVCYFIKRIPDIDYSVWVATAFTVVGIVTELIS